MVKIIAALPVLRSALIAFVADRRGATALEYSILIVMIMVALTGMLSMGGLAEKQNETFNTISSQLH